MEGTRPITLRRSPSYHVFTTGTDPVFFLRGGASLRNDFNLVSRCFLFVRLSFWRTLLILESRRSSQGVGGATPSDLLYTHTCSTCEAIKYNPLLFFPILLAEGFGTLPHLPSSSHHPATCVANFHSDLTNTFTKKDVTQIMSAST